MLASSCVRRVKACLGSDSRLVLVLPYVTAEFSKNEKSFLEYYDDVVVCEEAASAHFKAAITKRNRYMTDEADAVVCYVLRESGGAYAAMTYASSKNRTIIRVNA